MTDRLFCEEFYKGGSYVTPPRILVGVYLIEKFCLKTIEQLFLFVELLDKLKVCLPYSRLQLYTGGIPKKVEFK